MTTVTLLHPGAMGAAVAAQAVKAGHEVLWVPEGRSESTHQRAKETGAIACNSLGEALERSEIVLSICPPQVAEDVATTVAGHGFAGVYVEANAINPQRMQRIAEEIRPGTTVLDGAIFGRRPVASGRLASTSLAKPRPWTRCSPCLRTPHCTSAVRAAASAPPPR
ncbi:NAD(P)-binding domain-containing protein [Streptomyces sp. NPDC006514]|uniref:NAD(P)-binding domain-containing protein n=1 Tax=Streptomyces sp. NPDC006514 TaxID=3154308 RepID=UPI0033B5548D